MTTPSWIKGDLEIRPRIDGTGGNLSVAGTITVTGNLTAPNLSYVGHTHAASEITEGVLAPEVLPAATDEAPGAVTLITAEGLDGTEASDELVPTFAAAEEIAGAAVRAIPKGAGTTTYGLVRLDSPSGLKLSNGNLKFAAGSGLEIAGGDVDVVVLPSGGIALGAGGLSLDVNTAKTLLGLGAAAYLAVALNTGDEEDEGKIPVLNAAGKLPGAVIPKYAVSNTFVRDSQDAMLALGADGAEEGDFCVRSDIHRNFILSGSDPSVLANWVPFEVPSDLITTVRAEILDIVSGNYVTQTAFADTLDRTLTNIALTYATQANLTLAVETIAADYATKALLTASVAAALETVAGTYTTQAVLQEKLEELELIYAPVSHTHESADIIDTLEDGEEITAAETKIPQAKAVYDFVDSIVLRDELTPLTGTEIALTRATESFFKEIAGPASFTLDASGVSMQPGERVEFKLYLVIAGEGEASFPDWSWTGTKPSFDVPGTYLVTVYTIDGGWQWIASAEYYAYPQSPLLHRAKTLPAASGGSAEIALTDAVVEYHLPINAQSGSNGSLDIELDLSDLAFDEDDEHRRGFFAEIFLEPVSGSWTPPAITWTGIDRWMDFGYLHPRLEPGAAYIVQVFSFDAGKTVCAAWVEKRE